MMQLFLGKLKRVLQRNSPPEPSSAAINLMLGVGMFEVRTLPPASVQSAWLCITCSLNPSLNLPQIQF